MLTEKKKADRMKMAGVVIALAQEHGAAASIDQDWPGERAVMVCIRADRGLCLNIDFDGESPQPGVHVLSWHMALDVDTCFSNSFGSAGCSINSYHFRKATDIAHGFDDLCATLSHRLDQVATGEAFSDEREAARIAEAGETAAQRNARRGVYWNALAAADRAGERPPTTADDVASFIEKWAPATALL